MVVTNFSHACSPQFACICSYLQFYEMDKPLANCSRFIKFAKGSPATILHYTVYDIHMLKVESMLYLNLTVKNKD